MKKQTIWNQIKPGNAKSLWNAVNAAKDIGTTPLPNVMTLNGVVVSRNERSQCFADFFAQKVKSIVENTAVDA